MDMTKEERERGRAEGQWGIPRWGHNPPPWFTVAVSYNHRDRGVCSHGGSLDNAREVMECPYYERVASMSQERLEKTTNYELRGERLTLPDEILSPDTISLLRGRKSNNIWPGWWVRLTLCGAGINAEWAHLAACGPILTLGAVHHLRYTECSPVKGWAFLGIDMHTEYQQGVDSLHERLADEKARLRDIAHRLSGRQEAQDLLQVVNQVQVVVELEPIKTFPWYYQDAEAWKEPGLIWA